MGKEHCSNKAHQSVQTLQTLSRETGNKHKALTVPICRLCLSTHLSGGQRVLKISVQFVADVGALIKKPRDRVGPHLAHIALQHVLALHMIEEHITFVTILPSLYHLEFHLPTRSILAASQLPASSQPISCCRHPTVKTPIHSIAGHLI